MADRPTSILGAPAPERPPSVARRPMRDNPGLILLWIVLLLGALAAMITLADRSASLSPDFLSEVVLYALVAADVSILVALLFVLARNVVKLLVERRRALPFARFRSKLVIALLAMTLVPTVLVLIVGSELIRNSATRWFSAPIDDVLTSAREIAADYYGDRQAMVSRQAERIATTLVDVNLAAGDLGTLRDLVTPDVMQGRVGLVEIYRVVDEVGMRRTVPVVDVASPSLPRRPDRAAADRLAQQMLGPERESRRVEPLADGDLVRAAAVVGRPGAPPTGVVVVSDYLAGDVAQNARRIVDAYESYQQVRILRGPLEGVYLSFFFMMTLLILVSATWVGLYLAKRITRPVQQLAEGARAIAAGKFDHRIEPETRDEFGGLIEAFNQMAGELASSQRRLERSRSDLEQKNSESDSRRRYIETILERIATGVISVDAAGRLTTMNGAAMRLLKLDAAHLGRTIDEVFARDDLAPLHPAIARGMTGRTGEHIGQEVALSIDERDVHVALATTPLMGDGRPEGFVIVVDDVTPLIRAQKVAAWRDVARRLAHEVKNPLTPIQLSAERLRKHFGQAPDPTRAFVEECSSTIVQEVESLKLLVDEFAQFARMPAPRAVPTDLNPLIRDALSLYQGLFARLSIELRQGDAVVRARVDPEQFRRVIINLVDNAIDAVSNAPPPGGQGLVTIEASTDAGASLVRVVVADNGPGVPEADRARLFMPYYSTKQRGSGLGLAIVRRIVVEHGGSIEASANEPRGTRMTIELPL